jgi:phenylacetate-CoA ligase
MLTQIYERLPPPLQSVAASIRGYKLRSWRYGADADRLAAEALERDRWSAEAWRSWQEDRLARILHRAATAVPYYREQWAGRRRRGDRTSPEHLENWPILTKQTLRSSPRAFVADDCDVRRMLLIETSGTTGTPLALWRSRKTETAWYALAEARLRLWNGVSRHDRWSNIGGQRVTPGNRKKPPFWVWNAAMHQLYLSTYHTAPANVPAYLEAMARYRVRHVLGYPSGMNALASVALEKGLKAARLELFISNA